MGGRGLESGRRLAGRMSEQKLVVSGLRIRHTVTHCVTFGLLGPGRAE